MTVDRSQLKLLISEDEIQKRIEEIAILLSAKFKGETPIFIGILNGSFIFAADLLRKLEIECEIDFMKLASYSGKQSTGTVRLLKDISADITGRHVIIVEDIIDSGLTIKFIRERLREASPASVSIVTLLMKPDIAELVFPIDWVGFNISPDFVVGYGLDYEQKFRNLKGIYRLKGSTSDKNGF